MRRLIRLTKPINSDPIETIKEVLPVSQKILYDKNKEYIVYQEIIDDELNEGTELYQAALNLETPPIEILLKKKDLEETIFDIFCAINNKGWFITHILVKDITQIENFFGRKINIFLNIKVQEVEQVEDNLILFIVSSQKQAEIVDFKLTIKGVLNV
jgi:hypothetical protein